MALITCPKCSKSISSASLTCIHCGEQINNSQTEVPTSIPEESVDVNVESLPIFHKLNDKEQLELENRFLKSDKSIMNYRRKGEELKKFASNIFWLFLLARLLLVIQELAIENLFNGVVMNERMIEMSAIFVAGILLVWVASIAFWIYSLISYRSKSKRFLYIKKFQQWLLENEKIRYVPNLILISEKDKKLFDKIDLTTMKF